MAWLPILSCVIFGLVSTIYIFFKKKYLYWKDRGVDYLEPIFPTGNLSLREHLKDFVVNVYNNRKNGSPFIGAYIICKPVLMLTNLDLIQNVLIKDFSNFNGRGMYVNEKDDPLSAHMFSLDGEKWKSIRSKLSPTFTSGKMKFMFRTMVDVADRFNIVLADMIQHEPELDLKDLIGRFNMDVIGSCAFGIDCNCLNDPDAIFRKYAKKVFDEPHLSPFMMMFTLQYPELARKFGVTTQAKDVTDFFVRTVRDTIAYREQNNVHRNDFMDLLIGLRNVGDTKEDAAKLSEAEIIAQAFLFIMAGFDASASAITYCLYEMALNTDTQEKARQEIETILKKYDGTMSYEAIQDMVYIDQIISEVLRKYPPGVLLVRKTAHNYQVPNSEATIDEGTEVFIPVYAIHHDPEIYPNPDVFDPDRFAPENIKSRHPMSFLAFGSGPRNCIGLRFARMQSRVGLVTLLKNYRFNLSTKTPAVLEFDSTKPILTPKDKIIFRMEKV